MKNPQNQFVPLPEQKKFVIKLSGDDLANQDAAGGGVTERTKNLKMKRFEAFVNSIDEVELEEEGQGIFIVS